jgi:hypothetical protein
VPHHILCILTSILLALTLLNAPPAAAAAGTDPSDSRLELVSFRFGGGHSERSDVQIVPFMVQAGFRFPDLVDEPLSRIGLHLQWIVEGWVAPVFGPETTFEIGMNPIALRLAWDRGQTIVPFASAGIGFLYTGLRDIGAGGGFQFDETVGFGVEYFVQDDLSLSLAYRYRHMSNAGVYDDNAGLDTHYGLIGLSWHPKRVAVSRR